MKIAVSGASGAIASVLVPDLKRFGHQVLPLSRSSLPIPGTSWYDPNKPPEALIHLAVASHARDPGSSEELAAPHLRFIGDLVAKGWRGHLVFFSSAAVYAGGPLPISEAVPPDPPNPYGAAKLALELGFTELASAADLPLTILRPANIYGTAQDLERRRVIALLIEAARTATAFSLYGDGSSQRDYLQIDDLCRAMHQVLASPGNPGKARIFNLGSGQATSLSDLIGLVEEATNRPIARAYLPVQNEAASCVLDPARAARLLGWQAQVPLIDGIRRLVADLP